MKRKYFFMLGAVLLLITSCGPKRYGCNRGGCYVLKQTEKKTDKEQQIKKAAVGSLFSYISFPA